MKKITIFAFSILLIFVCSIALYSFSSGKGIRISDGRYFGYSASTQEWLFFDYQNMRVMQDGPYVFKNGEQHTAINITSNQTFSNKLTQTDISSHVEVVVDNDAHTKFVVKLRSSYPRSRLDIPSPEKLFALSDMEGNFDAMVDLLRTNGVINDELEWTYGANHLVLIGDMVDRGTNVVPLLWLIYKLESEAQLSGGNVHYVLGNHERYLLDGRVKSVARKYYGTFRTTGLSPEALWTEASELGRWLRSKPVLLKIGDTLFAHGGVSPKVLSANMSLGAIDKEAEENFVLNNTIRRNIDGSILHDKQGLLYYRNLIKDMDQRELGAKADAGHVDQVLTQYQVKRIAIGHTLVDRISQDYDGKVLRIDVPHSEGTSEALVIEGESLWVVDAQGNKSALGGALKSVQG